MAKGGEFERQVCRMISKWWSGGRHDDLFWRSSQSGGRATVRHRKGKRTRGHESDITATDDVGLPLIRTITFELKRGYNKDTLHNLIDRPRKPKNQKKPNTQTYEDWIAQATAAAERAKTPYWAIIHRRDGREPTILVPEPFPYYVHIAVAPSLTITFEDESAIMYPLAEFFFQVDPEDVKQLYKESRRGPDQN